MSALKGSDSRNKGVDSGMDDLICAMDNDSINVGDWALRNGAAISDSSRGEGDSVYSFFDNHSRVR